MHIACLLCESVSHIVGILAFGSLVICVDFYEMVKKSRCGLQEGKQGDVRVDRKLSTRQLRERRALVATSTNLPARPPSSFDSTHPIRYFSDALNLAFVRRRHGYPAPNTLAITLWR